MGTGTTRCANGVVLVVLEVPVLLLLMEKHAQVETETSKVDRRSAAAAVIPKSTERTAIHRASSQVLLYFRRLECYFELWLVLVGWWVLVQVFDSHLRCQLQQLYYEVLNAYHVRIYIVHRFWII